MKCAAPCPFDAAGTPCQLENTHAGNHSWPMVIDMEGWLPVCAVCGSKAAQCGCPAVDEITGWSNAVQPVDPPPADGVAQAYARNATMHWPEPVVAEEKTERRTRWQWVPPKTALSATLPPVPARPWCPAHGWDTNDECTGCADARRAYEAT